MEHSLISELRVLARTLEQWEGYIERNLYNTTQEQVERWQIGVEHDITQALEHMKEHFEVIKRARA